MLMNLHVKNLALIDEADVDLKEGLNILTGETGAGKSIIIGSMNLALGGKCSKDIIRSGADYALVELVFQTESGQVKQYFEEHDLNYEDGQLIISRKIMNGKNIAKVNGETVSVSILKEIASMLMDIHGQHDNENLLKPSKHLAMLDEYGGSDILELKKNLSELYKNYQVLQQKLESFSQDETGRMREISLLEFEVHEIEEAALQKNEDHDLEEEYRRMSNMEKITAGLSEICNLFDGDNENIRDQIGRAVKGLADLSEYDEHLAQCYESVSDIETLCNDLARELVVFQENLSFDDGQYEYIKNRLDFINRLKLKYGKTIEEIQKHKKEAQEKLDFYQNFEEEKEKTEKELETVKKELGVQSDKLTQLRKSAAAEIRTNIVKALQDLNFLEVQFDVEFQKMDTFSANGNDSVQFLISTNPGESLKPLSKVASGGELSRIMLGFKTILAGKDEVETLIFDEIDTGISGRTAQMVSEKLKQISKNHQVVCITHLPQIASMADSHYLIQKSVQDGKTSTQIRALDETQSVEELARMLGGAKITDTVLESAREMRRLASGV